MGSAARLVAPILLMVGIATPVAAQVPVELRWRAEIDGRALRCGDRFDAVGATKAPATLADFRFYVSAVHLLRAGSGEAVPLALEQDGIWQHRDVALLDFEDGAGSCNIGTSGTRNVVRGTVPAGDWRGLRFTLGVPADLNHDDPTLAPAPLNLTAMFWSWQAGYKFFKLDLAPVAVPGGTRPVGFSFHVGSTGCAGGVRGGEVPRCANLNRVTVELPDFDPRTDGVIADVGALLANTAIDQNAPRTSPGCMSFPKDADCNEVMPRIGLAYDGRPTQGQVLFRRAPLP